MHDEIYTVCYKYDSWCGTSGVRRVTRVKGGSSLCSILDCSEELLFIMHEILGMLESTKQQDVNQLKGHSFCSNKTLVITLR